LCFGAVVRTLPRVRSVLGFEWRDVLETV
jgi:hypothetical protein